MQFSWKVEELISKRECPLVNIVTQLFLLNVLKLNSVKYMSVVTC